MIKITKEECEKIHENFSALYEIATLLLNQKTCIEALEILQWGKSREYLVTVRALHECAFNVNVALISDADETYFRSNDIVDVRKFITSHVTTLSSALNAERQAARDAKLFML